MKQNMVIKTVHTNQQDILAAIIQLYCPEGFDADVTYSKGNFYKNGIPEPKYKFDLTPQTEDTVKADIINFPIREATFSSVIFDPPFVAAIPTGTSKPGIIRERFGCFRTVQNHLWPFYKQALSTLYAILFVNGFLIFKCQDVIDSGKQYMSHVEIMNYAVRAGFYPKDLFILVAKNRLNHMQRQLHARKYHSYFWVFEKKDSKVIYSV